VILCFFFVLSYSQFLSGFLVPDARRIFGDLQPYVAEFRSPRAGASIHIPGGLSLRLVEGNKRNVLSKVY